MTLTLFQHQHEVIQTPFIDFESCLNQFLESSDVRANSKATYERQMKAFFDWLTKTYPAHNLSLLKSQDIYSYKAFLLNDGYNISTVINYLSVVKKFFSWLEDSKILPDIARNVKRLKKPKGFRKDCLTREQIREALAVFDINTAEGLRDFALFNLLVRTGLRAIEVSRATVGDLRQIDGDAVLYIQGKGKDLKDDFVLITPETLRPLRAYLASRGLLLENAPLFVSTSNKSKGQGLATRTISYIVKETLRKINIDDLRLSAHSLRHTAISLSIKGGASLLQVQAMARHADPKTTMVYFHNNERISAGAEKFINF